MAVDTVEDILALGNAFCTSQALLTAAELDLFTVLHGNSATEEEIRARLGLPGRGLGDLLRLLTALGLLRAREDRYRNAPAAEKFLVSGKEECVGGLLRGLRANLYPAWGGLVDTIRTGKPRSTGDGFDAMLNDPAELDRYARMMDGVLRVVGPRLIEAVDWRHHRSVLDVGGCRGTLMGQLVAARPELTGQVFDLPQLEPLFDAYVAGLGTADRIGFRAGDFFRDPLPRADVLIFGHILHNWSHSARETLVHKAYAAINPGGVLLVHDRMLAGEESDVDNLVASLIMALMTDEGAEYPVAELREMAVAAGFTAVRHRPLGGNETLLTCHKGW